MRAGGSQAFTIRAIRSQLMRVFWLRRLRLRYHSRATWVRATLYLWTNEAERYGVRYW
jgi:hypothetical protein